MPISRYSHQTYPYEFAGRPRVASRHVSEGKHSAPEPSPFITGFLTVVIVAGMMILMVEMFRLRIPDVYRFGSFALLASAAAGFKIALPGMTGTLSANFLFILYGLVEFTLPETTILGCFLTLMQCLWHQGRATLADQKRRSTWVRRRSRSRPPISRCTRPSRTSCSWKNRSN